MKTNNEAAVAEEMKSQTRKLANDLFWKVQELSKNPGVDFDELFDIVADELEGVHLPAAESELLQKLVEAANGKPKTHSDEIAMQKATSQKILEYVRRGLSEDADRNDLEAIWFDVYRGSFEESEKAGWRFRQPIIKDKYAKRLIECSEKTGRSVQSLTDEMAGDFCDSFVVAYIHGAERRARKKKKS